jgi:hypothetical protein
MKWVVSKLIESLLAFNHMFNDANSIFISFLNSSKLELVNIILISSANKIGLDFLLIVFYKSFT